MKQTQMSNYKAVHFGWTVSGKVATITLNRPERKNPLTLESYAELRDLFRQLVYATDIKTVVFTGAGEHHRLDVGGIDQLAKQIPQLGVGFQGQWILALGTIQRNGGDLAGDGPPKMDGLVI